MITPLEPKKKSHPIFFEHWSIYLCRELPIEIPPTHKKMQSLQALCPPASDPLRQSAPVLVPPGCGEYPLSGSDGYHNECGYPTAEHSERHTSQLATYTSPAQDAGQVNSTKDTESSAQLSQGCNPAPYQGCITTLPSSGECITPLLHTAIRVNKATTPPATTKIVG